MTASDIAQIVTTACAASNIDGGYFRIYTDIAQLVAAACAAIGLFLVWKQVRKQTTQHFSDRVLALYHELDTDKAREERRFVYIDFPTLESPTKEQVDRVIGYAMSWLQWIGWHIRLFEGTLMKERRTIFT